MAGFSHVEIDNGNLRRQLGVDHDKDSWQPSAESHSAFSTRW